jgi:hypothetical protein
LNHGFFQRPQVPVNVGPEIFEVEQRVGHQLAGAVKRDVAPPINAVKRGPVGRQGRFVE